MALTEHVTRAIADIEACFGSASVSSREDGEGGAYVVVDNVPLGGPWAEPSTWVGFRITHTYPYADVYPHFVRRDLTRSDGRAAIGEAMSHATFEDREAIQLSRASRRRDPVRETALLKLQKVLAWLRGRP